MEVYELKIIAHLVFVLNLGFSFQNCSFERNVFRLQLLNELILLFEFVEHVLSELFSIVFANATVFCSA